MSIAEIRQARHNSDQKNYPTEPRLDCKLLIYKIRAKLFVISLKALILELFVKFPDPFFLFWARQQLCMGCISEFPS